MTVSIQHTARSNLCLLFAKMVYRSYYLRQNQVPKQLFISASIRLVLGIYGSLYCSGRASIESYLYSL